MKDWRIDPVLILLALVMAFLVTVAVAVSVWVPNNGQLFMLIAGLITATSGSFFTRLKPEATEKAKDDNKVDGQ